jgi:hypothetical protein
LSRFLPRGSSSQHILHNFKINVSSYYKNKIIKNVLLSMKDSKEEMADKNKG